MDKTHGFERTDSTDPADYCAEKKTAEFYTADELKAAGLFKNARTSRTLGVIFSYPEVYIIYNFGAAVLEMENKTEESFFSKAKLVFYDELQGKCYYEFPRIIYVGNSMELVSKIMNAIKELETVGYVKRTMMHGDDGKITGMEYKIFEEPYIAVETEEHNEEKPCEDKPCTANPSAKKPHAEEPSEEKPSTDKASTENPSMVIPAKGNSSEENPWVNNTKTNKKENNNILYNNTQSNPIPSKNKISFNMSEIDRCRWEIKDNIEYDILVERDHIPRDMLDEIVELMVETICSKNETITIASNTYSHELVKKKFLKINSDHIEYVIDCVSKNTTKVSNIKQYMLAAIFNAPNTIGSDYTTRVNRELYG